MCWQQLFPASAAAQPGKKGNKGRAEIIPNCSCLLQFVSFAFAWLISVAVICHEKLAAYRTVMISR